MASFREERGIVAGGTYTMPYDGRILVGASGGTVTVQIKINGTDYNDSTTITDGNYGGFAWNIPQGTVLTFTGANADILAYNS